MKWQNPLYLWLLIAIPVLVGLVWWRRKRWQARRNRYFSDSLFESLRLGNWAVGRRARMIVLYIGLALLIVGLAGPKIGTRVKQVKRQGVDLLIAVDLSASMKAEDVKPSRLKKAKYEVSRLVDRLKGDRVGLVVFTGDAYLQAPLTLDYSAMRLFLNVAEPSQMPNSATDFGAAMQAALKAFNAKSDKKQDGNTKASKILLIISDGENHGESFQGPLAALKKHNISVYSLGIGTRSGSTIPLYDKSGNLRGYKRNSKGKIINTKLQPSVLRNIAKKGGGKYYQIQNGNESIDAFLARLDKLQQGTFASQQYADFENQYQWLAAIGLGFVVISLLVPVYRNRARQAQK